MKSGCSPGLYALGACASAARPAAVRAPTFVANPDEEIGSPFSTPHVERVAADSDVAFSPGVRPRERRHRLVAQGDRRLRHHGPRPRRPRRRRAGEGPQRDPRRGPPGRRAARADRALARRHLQRRRDRGRDPSQRRRRADRPGGRPAGRHAGVDGGGRRGDPGAGGGAGGPRRDDRRGARHRHWPMEKLERSGRLVELRQGLAAASASRSATPRPAEPRTRTRRRAWACRRSTASARSAGWTTPRRSGWTSRASCRGPRSSPRCSWRPGATRRFAHGGAEP